ncbi:hypothetical protein [Enhygromyxa salina]|nr:hypothetical protein [Enhygromyxa salina]
MFVLSSVIGACSPGPVADPQPQCYPLDPSGDWPLTPEQLTEQYCGRGPTPTTGETEGRALTAVCIPAPSEGCDPCMLSAAEVDDKLRAKIANTLADASCPEDYEPTRFVRGCAAASPTTNECCFIAEYFTDKTVCDPVPDEAP